MGDAARRRRAIRLAFDSGWGDRLVEIAQEHASLAAVLSDGRLPADDRSVLGAKINQLRQERDEIIDKFMEVETDA